MSLCLLFWVYSQKNTVHSVLSQYLWVCGPRFLPSPGSAKAHRLPDLSSLLLEAGFLKMPSQLLLLLSFVVPEKQRHLGYGELKCPEHQLEGHGPLKMRVLRTGAHHKVSSTQQTLR